MLEITTVEVFKQPIPGRLQERGKSQDFECKFKLDLEKHSRKVSREIIQLLLHETSKMN